jgi:eukaryotic-like serine/threonine-protein kinase
VKGMTAEAAKAALEAAGCKLGEIKPGADNEDQAGKVTDQGTPGGSTVPRATEVNVTVAGPVCIVPGLIGMTEDAARTAVVAVGCKLETKQGTAANPEDVGKVIDQTPAAKLSVLKGSTVTVTIATTSVLGASLVKGSVKAAPELAKTGGVVLAGLALWLLISGLMAQVAGSKRLWRLARRREG